MKIRVIALLMVAIIALFALVACGGNEETTEATTANNAGEQNGEKTTLGDYFETEEVLGEEISPEG